MTIWAAVVFLILLSCNTPTENHTPDSVPSLPVQGTWKLLSGTLTEKGVATVTDYTKDKEFIKIINDTHFAFLSHDLAKGKDTATALFSAGGGTYTLADSSYTEHFLQVGITKI